MPNWKVLVAFALMLALPLGYRVWITVNPPPQKKAVSLAELLSAADADRAQKLLSKPLDGWTAADRRDYPAVAEWLASHHKTVLPWEWTDEARRKTPKDYFKTWQRVFDDLEGRIEDSLRMARRELNRAKGAAEDNRLLLDHQENQLRRLEERFRIGRGKDRSVTVETLTKGTLWGWNRKSVSVAVTNESAWSEVVDGERGKRDRLRQEAERLAENASRLERRASGLEALLKDVGDRQRALASLREADAERRERLLESFVQASRASVVSCLNKLPTLRPGASD